MNQSDGSVITVVDEEKRLVVRSSVNRHKLFTGDNPEVKVVRC